MEYIYNFVVCKKDNAIQIFMIQEDNQYTLLTLTNKTTDDTIRLLIEEEDMYTLMIDSKESITLNYYGMYSLLYHQLKDDLMTEYKDKDGRIIFSEQMPKEYFNSDELYNGEEWGYFERDLDEISEFNRFSKPLFNNLLL